MRQFPTRRNFLVAAAVGAVAARVAAQTRQGNGQDQSHSPSEKKQAFRFLTLTMFVETSSEDTNGVVSIMRVFVPAGDGAAPHVHSREDEIHTIVRGHYRYRHGDAEVDAPAGTVIFMPRNIPHVFRNVGTESGEHLVTLIPGGLEKMFREVSDAQIEMPRDAAKLNEIYGRYGVTSLPPASLPLSTGH